MDAIPRQQDYIICMVAKSEYMFYISRIWLFHTHMDEFFHEPIPLTFCSIFGVFIVIWAKSTIEKALILLEFWHLWFFLNQALLSGMLTVKSFIYWLLWIFVALKMILFWLKISLNVFKTLVFTRFSRTATVNISPLTGRNDLKTLVFTGHSHISGTFTVNMVRAHRHHHRTIWEDGYNRQC